MAAVSGVFRPGPGTKCGYCPGLGFPASRARSRAVRARSAARSSSSARMRSAAVSVQPSSNSSLTRAAKASCRVAAAPAARPGRGHRARRVQRAQERLSDAQDLGRPAGGVGRVVLVVQITEPSGQAGTSRVRRGRGKFQLLLTVSFSPRYIKSVSVIDLATLPKVPGGLIGMDLATREWDTAFADLMCADTQWLRDEFDELISQSFSQPPAPPRPAPPRVPPFGGPWRPPSGPRSRVHPARVASTRAAPGRRRERSPPA